MQANQTSSHLASSKVVVRTRAAACPPEPGCGGLRTHCIWYQGMAVLEWDELVKMPEASADARSQQKAALAEVMHDRQVSRYGKDKTPMKKQSHGRKIIRSRFKRNRALSSAASARGYAPSSQCQLPIRTSIVVCLGGLKKQLLLALWSCVRVELYQFCTSSDGTRELSILGFCASGPQGAGAARRRCQASTSRSGRVSSSKRSRRRARLLARGS